MRKLLSPVSETPRALRWRDGPVVEEEKGDAASGSRALDCILTWQRRHDHKVVSQGEAYPSHSHVLTPAGKKRVLDC